MKVRLVLPGIPKLLLPKEAVTPTGRLLTERNAVLPELPQAPGLLMVMVVPVVNTFGAMPISFTVPAIGLMERL